MLWGLQPVEQQAAYGLAVDRLRRQIHSGLLLPSEKLPAERALSERFGISRVTLREALRVLETSSYIRIKRGAHGGAFISDADRLEELARRHVTRAPGDAMRVLEFLSVNQLAAAEYGARRRGPAELKRMRQSCDMLDEASGPAQRKQAETLFHLALASTSHNTLISRAIEEGLGELFLPFEAGNGASPGTADMPHACHRIFEAVEAGDPEAAQEAMAGYHEVIWSSLRNLTRSAA